MKILSYIVAVATVILSLASCSSPESQTEETTTPSTSSTANSSTISSSSTSSVPETSSSEPQPAAEAEPSLADAPLTNTAESTAEPTLTECVYGGGSWTTNGLYSDGTIRWAQECQNLHDEQMAKYPYRCPQTDHYVSDPSQCSSPVDSGTGGSDYDPSIPAYMTRSAEVEQMRAENQKWWFDCQAEHSAEFCLANDPWAQ
ncbi:hypothetical protein HMPREF0305_10633 [Corynebacterium pseudogenitalium ATCC 33035]|uniref:Secreted protein n=1 Tax=Corynebacterium pseudogenitalium ATCC 33035 TaxID=525264 RepID=E2S2B0_9CORY|nr:hypothetical protein HMPREF0305_10633 [Corynebacterium pseudogenitalium ATCC 33035]